MAPAAPSIGSHPPPTGPQRSHWKEEAIGWAPDQVPGATPSAWPTRAVPVTAGGVSGRGGSPGSTMTPVAAEAAEDDPTSLVAVSRTRIVVPRSSGPRVYVVATAPGTSTHVGAHRCHAYVNASGGVPAHVPGTTVSVRPRSAAPVTVGGASGAGGRIAWAICAVASELAEAEPARFVPISRTRIVRSKSSGPRR